MGSQIQWNQTGRKQELHHQHVRTSREKKFLLAGKYRGQRPIC